MINIDGKSYYLDLKKISEFVNFSDGHTLKESEIIDTYEADENDKSTGLGVSSKTVREVVSQGNTQVDSIRYDLVKSLVLQLLGYGYDDGESTEDLPFGFELAFNTLIKEGFLVEIK